MAPRVDDDFELLMAWHGGDQNAGNALVRRHFTRIYRFFRIKLDDAAEDLTQQVMLAALESAERLTRGASFQAYLFGIARRQLMLHLRKRYRAAKVFDPDAASIQDIVRSGDSPSRVVAARREQLLLAAGLRELPLELQITLELFYWEQLSVADIAAVTEVAPGTVKSRLSRARGILEAWLAEREPADDDREAPPFESWLESVQAHFEDEAPEGSIRQASDEAEDDAASTS